MGKKQSAVCSLKSFLDMYWKTASAANCPGTLKTLQNLAKRLATYKKMKAKPYGAFELSVSAGYIGLSCLLCALLRRLVIRLFPEASLPRTLLQEAIATAELCACCFELIIVADNFGVYTYAVFLFFLTVWWSYCWSEASACPYIHLEEVVQGDADIRDAALKIWAELAGGLLVYKYVAFLWSLETVSTHKRRAIKKCTADLQVPAFIGAVIECFATCVCRLASRTISEIQPRFGLALDAAIGTTLVVLAFDYSGGYFNPALATSLKFGCKGNTNTEHIVVYWVGACFGSMLSLFIYSHPLIKSLIEKVKTE